MKLQNHYKAESVATASPARLVTMLYDRALQGLDVAETALTARPQETETANRELVHVQRILNELIVTLDHDRGGELATNLADIYDYCIRRLTEANLDKSPMGVIETRRHLAGIRDAWVSAVGGLD